MKWINGKTDEHFSCSPAVAHDGTLTPPALDQDGTIYFGNWGHCFYAIGTGDGEIQFEEYNSNTPGFELVFVLVGGFIAVLLSKKKREFV